MNVSEINNTLESTHKSKAINTLGKDDFLKILVAQLQSQDPLEPLKDTDFIAQMAQFSALEQMNNLNNSFSLSQAISLVGKEVVAKVTDSQFGGSDLITDTVESVYSNNGTTYLKVGSHYVTLDNIHAIFE